MAKPKPTVYQRIKIAAQAGKGLRLTAKEAYLLHEIDTAIRFSADDDDFDMGTEGLDGDPIVRPNPLNGIDSDTGEIRPDDEVEAW